MLCAANKLSTRGCACQTADVQLLDVLEGERTQRCCGPLLPAAQAEAKAFFV